MKGSDGVRPIVDAKPGLGPILGIESSCDETAVAVLDADGRVLAEAVLSQEEHASFGGVVPEIAARAHLRHLPGLVGTVLGRAGVGASGLGAVAATGGPGLIGGLIVGSTFGKGIALVHDLPFMSVNHLEAHALTARLPGLATSPVEFPYVVLLVSGGHCQCVLAEDVGHYRRLGGTMDDAVGEAFDKVGKMLGLPWPGGPAVERLAASGDPARFALPRPLLGRPGCDFSFSGLKTAVASLVRTRGPADFPDVAASFQAAVADVLADRARNALRAVPHATSLVVAGGVAANGAVRAGMKHALLVWLVDALRRKPAPFLALDTHAGPGRADLASGPPERTGEWHDGVARLLPDPPAPLRRYLGLVDALGLYPGSPQILRALLRPGDQLVCCELHREDHAALRRTFAGDHAVAVHKRDGYAAIPAFLPPRSARRALVLVDPPFEQAGEFDRLLEALRSAAARMPNAVVACWYPVKGRAPARDFHRAVCDAGLPDAVAAELWVREPTDAARLNGCGLLVRNPPHLFEDDVPAILHALLQRLSDGHGAGAAVLRLTDERLAA